ncbi:MAG: RecQ family ATP-dependent DNA helicase, partial [Flavobacteriaceae bacterium]|nr:RecQ family ATP-dependent DNA helicase [Flavobacteriaceae bacterium]
MMNSIHDILQKYWNHKVFRDPQKEIINAVIKKNDVFALLPTGAGKSLCFQIPALTKSGVCIVISPLIALMEDQVNSLQKKNIKALALTSKYNIEDTIKAFDNLRYGNYKFLYLSPEKLQSEFIQDKISQLEVNLIAVDEAHCISQWGHDFRPAYLKISILKKIHPQVNIIALTASATPKVMNDIVKNLELKNVQIFKKSFSRKNLIYSILKAENKLDKLEKVLLAYDEPVIVYTNTRKNCIDISKQLNRIGYKSSYYHGGLQNNEKLVAFNNWMEEKTPIMVATNAFGMGIDKNNVRAVIHMNIPNSIENYLQEVGRAGRDGIKSFAILIYNDNTIFECKDFLDKGIATPQFHKEVYS